jgi:hypothetical protein
MVKENSRKENEQKLFKNFSSKEEMQRMRESVSADVLYQEKYKFLRQAIGTLKTASSTAEYRQILHETNSQHFPGKIQGNARNCHRTWFNSTPLCHGTGRWTF